MAFGHTDIPARVEPALPKPTAAAQPCPAEPTLNVFTHQLNNAEELREATRGADLKVVQLSSGQFQGKLTHAEIGRLSLSAGDFAPDIRARGVMNPDLLTIGMLVQSSGEVRQWDYEVIPGDIIVFPKGVEQEGRFTGHTRYLTLTLTGEDLAAYSTGEYALQDPKYWTRIAQFRSSPAIRDFICFEVSKKIADLRTGTLPDSAAAVQYFRRTLLEAFVVGVLDQQGPPARDRDRHNASRIIRSVEDLSDSLGSDQPIHISELCLMLGVSRRTLHRAFHDVLGTGPVEYLRLKRLAVAHQMLGDGQGSVTQIALNNGFTDLGRFAGYYRRTYGEHPSQTLKRRSAGRSTEHMDELDLSTAD